MKRTLHKKPSIPVAIQLLFLAIIVIFIVFYSPFLTLRSTEMPTDPEGNFILYVSDQSSAISPVDIRVIIDGKVAVNDDFYYSYLFSILPPGHIQKGYSFKLEPGNHTINVTSKRGEAELRKEFEIVDKHWALIIYSSDPKHFYFDIQDEPMYFL